MSRLDVMLLFLTKTWQFTPLNGNVIKKKLFSDAMFVFFFIQCVLGSYW